MSDEIKTRIFEYGDENEGTWPSQFGTGVRGHFRMKIGKPKNEKGVPYHIIQDEMPPTKHPITGEMFTSKAQFREVTRAHGYDEVGTAYENGYEPESQQDSKALENSISEKFREVIRHGIKRRE
jgi:hypothetical protein